MNQPPEKTQDRFENDPRLRLLLQVLSYSILCGMAFLLIASIVSGSLALVMAGIATAGAALLSGGLVGFLFGIPRTVQAAGEGRDLQHQMSNSLEQVADWLTKILLGATLTQLIHVPLALQSVGEYVSDRAEASWASPFIAGAVVYFGGLGFLLVYVFTRLDYTRLLVTSDLRLKDRIDEVYRKAREFGKQVEKKLNASLRGVGKRPEPPSVPERAERAASGVKDPNKGLFDGQSESNARKLTATVGQSGESPEWFEVTLTVESTDPDRPIQGTVWFYLHPSFHESEFPVEVQSGKAEATVLAYGAFTVGVLADDGQTRLELDLATLDDAPAQFRQR